MCHLKTANVLFCSLYIIAVLRKYIFTVYALSALLFITVLEALSQEFHTGCPWGNL